MDTFTKNRWLAEFPFIKNVPLSMEHCARIVVRRATPFMFHAVPHLTTIHTDFQNIIQGDEVFIIGGGEHLATVKPSVYLVKDEAEAITHGQSVLEAVYENGLETKAEYILWVRVGDEIVGNKSMPYWSLTIYRPNKEETPEQLIEAALARAEQEVQTLSNM